MPACRPTSAGQFEYGASRRGVVSCCHGSSGEESSMSHMGKAHLIIMFTVGAEDVAEGDRIFASHGEWIKGHPREGDLALLAYTVSKAPELLNPMDPSSEPTGKT